MKKEEIEIVFEDGQPKHAKQLLDFYRLVGAESPYLTFGEEGLGINQEQETRYLKQIQETTNNRLLLASLNGEIIGVASIGAPSNPKTGHVGEIGICILRRFWGMGLSRVMMEDMIEWAEESPSLRYLRLEVNADNIRAIKLYEHYNFEIIGKTPSGMFCQEDYQDVLMMGRRVDEAEDE
ncbi:MULTISPECIES: GNAT family N-acetyltransferase [Aerococcus]|uniref:GNAT family N-acetyltransferase n=1 Tax=Aerococcus sanguinicola TaxID=119206 RepID=A0A5N1GPA7_9LACT|nr:MULTISPECIES: GNAT family protein [Aerococcus]KAA9302099.1 GNAT family N-acetyltransferase [Aerococcus sanguinicola]MDK6368472.1 GNAT family protein [Aerococcus sp. UMB9870]MDK6679555.1 GNAT family protein [Aerococcus sp. UMB8608]MDK6686399.1 GNAT family protein [Aerococcus sp. UMB8623]MDK6940979.1 GNAT family protein [Aerococcus sp. UMB8487]